MTGRSWILAGLALLGCAAVLLVLALGGTPSDDVARPPAPSGPAPSSPAPSSPAPTSPAPTSPDPGGPATETVRIGSFNVYWQLSQRRARTAVLNLLARDVALLGLQEWNNPNRRAATRALVAAGWGVYSPVGDTAVVWDAEEYALLSSRATKNSEAVDVGPPGPGSRTGRRTHAFWAATVRLRDLSSGQVVSLTSIHHPAHVSLQGRPRAGITAERLAHRRRSEAVLADLVRREQRAADHVFVTGDYNVDYRYDRALRHEAFTESTMRSLGMVNAFAGRPLARGTLGTKVYDGVYAARRASDATVLATGWGSDHRPVIATYEFPTASAGAR